ncbi:MAG: hypothetical protein AAGA37_06500 [Actinomycetota bacterium]
MTKTYTCPACGYQDLQRSPFATWPPPPGVVLTIPYQDHLGSPSYETCPLCGFEFGETDNPGTAQGDTFEAHAAAWIEAGRPPYDDGYELPEQHRPTDNRDFRGFVWMDDGLAEPIVIEADSEIDAAAKVADRYGADRAFTLWNELDGDDDLKPDGC